LRLPGNLFIYASIALLLLYHADQVVSTSAFGAETVFDSFGVQGIMVRNQPFGMIQYNFSISVASNAWEILLIPTMHKLDPVDGQGAVIPDYIHAVSDGLEFRVVMGFTNTSYRVENRAIAARGPGSVPFAVTPEVVEIWYVFASHTYLASKQSGQHLIPIEYSSSTPREGGTPQVPASWRLLEEYPRLPREICFWYEQDAKPAQAALSLTNTHIYVQQTTNIGGYSIPWHVKSEFYFLMSTNLYARGFSDIRGYKYSRYSKPGGFPKLPGRAAISDFRFATNTSSRVVTRLTNDWPSDAVAKTVARAEVEAPRARIIAMRIACILTIVLVPAGILIRTYKHTKQHN
jgi:hypothetical protein